MSLGRWWRRRGPEPRDEDGPEGSGPAARGPEGGSTAAGRRPGPAEPGGRGPAEPGGGPRPGGRSGPGGRTGLVVGEPSIRFAYPEIPSFGPSPDRAAPPYGPAAADRAAPAYGPADPQRAAPPWIPAPRQDDPGARWVAAEDVVPYPRRPGTVGGARPRRDAEPDPGADRWDTAADAGAPWDTAADPGAGTRWDTAADPGAGTRWDTAADAGAGARWDTAAGAGARWETGADPGAGAGWDAGPERGGAGPRWAPGGPGPGWATEGPGDGPEAAPRIGADSPEALPPPSEARQRELVREAVALVDDQDRLLRDFYNLIFALGGPEVVGMFPTDLRRQRLEFGRALVQWVSADDPATLAAHLDQLGADHRKFDVEPAHYAVAGDALVAAVRGRTAGRFTADHELALRGSYGRLATVMIEGALRRIAEPPYWQAEIVAHHRYQDDFAVVTLQPAAPYPYRAGQYTTVELASRPRLWRQMSVASAPRPDNTFDLHVRAVPGGDVSGALVRHTRPGDRLRIGPARGGALVVEPGTVRGLLCIAAGTGAAPIAAVVESVLTWRTPPALYAYIGARTADDLYPVHYLASRTTGRPDVVVKGVVAGEPSFPGLRGRVEDVVPDLAPWADLGVDVLVAGPTGMMDRTVGNLLRAGVPADRIRFDQYETTES